MAWSSALIWAEKALLLSGGSIEDLLWLADALVTNGQYRQAEELLVNPRYSKIVQTSHTGRYLASVVAMRLGRAEAALELLSMDAKQLNVSADGSGGGMDMAQTPTTKRPGTNNNKNNNNAEPVSLFDASMGPANKAYKDATNTTGDAALSNESEREGEGSVALNPRAWMLYMQGAAVVQLSNVGATDATPSIKQLRSQFAKPDRMTSREAFSAFAGASAAAGRPSTRGEPPPMGPTRLAGMDALVARVWTEALRVDARCWEAWTGLRDYGLLTPEEELELINTCDWASCCGGSDVVAQFFRNYCLATTLSSPSQSQAAIGATEGLLAAFPQLAQDPALRTIQAARLLALGRARESLEYTVSVLEHRRVPDTSATAIHITALTVLHAKDALFRIAHELAEEFGLSAIKRAEIEPSDTGAGMGTGTDSSARLSAGALTSLSTPRGPSLGAAAAGTGRLRTGARGLLVPETPSRPAGPVFGTHAGASTQRQCGSGSSASAARAVGQTAWASATAAWRGLWGLPTWTHPGPPVLATYPSALGPAQATPVSSAESTLNTFTTGNAQSAGSPTQYEFIGASLAWYAIGSYYLVSAELMARPRVCGREWALLQVPGGGGSFSGLGSAMSLRRSQPLAPEAEHMLAEARRWLAKTTLASPRSIVAWTAFAHTFVVAGEWESATRALHTAVGLCGCEGVVHGGGRDPRAELPNQQGVYQHQQQTPSKQQQAGESSLLGGPPGAAEVERGSRLAHVPLASLGAVYLQTGDLGMAESCLDASARCLTGYRITQWLSRWKPSLDAAKSSKCLSWCAEASVSNAAVALEEDPVCAASLLDPQLLNDAGMLYYANKDLATARSLFMLALRALNTHSRTQHTLHGAFGIHTYSKRLRSTSLLSPELQAYYALAKTNLGNTLRRLGDYSESLECLREAEQHSPADTDITLSIAFALHSRAISKCAENDRGAEEHPCTSAVAMDRDLDEAIDMYHRILADRPGDPVCTDLLSLALELSVSIQQIPVPINDEEVDVDDLFALRSLDEIGLLSLDPPPGLNSESDAQHADNVSQQSIDESADEDSDETMDIEEDSD
ncbi:anaphase-promoting complex subunit Cut9 [Coemansia erecta]|nr:anaphase-promoting complex subunit Cut9 [Coemansia erecta]